MSWNYPCGVSDADIDEHYGDCDDDTVEEENYCSCCGEDCGGRCDREYEQQF
jgi:hypothetical protein